MSSSVEVPTLHTTMGALMIGTILAAVLWGVSCMQTYEYFSMYRKTDDPRLKVMVVVVFLLDTVQQVFVTHTLYEYLVVHYYDPANLGVVEWSLLAQVAPSGLIALLVQSFFTYRVFILSRKNIPITLFLGSLVFAEFGVTIAYFVRGWSVKLVAEIPSKLTNLSRSMNAVGAAGDICITISLISLLQRSKSGFRRTDAMMNQLILFSLNSGLLTSICAITSLILVLVCPDTFLYITFYILLGRLYTNSLLATLNARFKIRGQQEGESFMAAVSMDATSVERRTLPGLTSSANSSKPQHIVIKRETEIEVLADYELGVKSSPS
ncbi:uncharacterized protein BT62DRAFT_975955 [Guyanagaster necrorhizus]|uniref:DUF6534 domain-containing protein n=1 Tax=Guyanagaster necrorhizus TaxID=856835 RepID=A0A9P8AM64_9AGAR|nr:uncharacterized protein BT62DRAFT_975955 [Guyanagaster necrorhizus MCA 3950]KAG7440404.1 hypothetical protein BT62DRAFT_975955 [Guyanagaster necrorhizus MCA 3950]